MLRKLSKGLFLILILFFLSACSVPKVSTRFYIEDIPRVVQEMNGNAGYLTGKPKEPIEPPLKKTRKIYILEFSKELDQAPRDEELYGMDLSREIERSNYELPQRTKRVDIPTTQKISLPSFEDGDDLADVIEPNSTGGSFREYKVAEKDTLQKISKKFYDSYSKWHKIYEANKSLIKDSLYLNSIL